MHLRLNITLSCLVALSSASAYSQTPPSAHLVIVHLNATHNGKKLKESSAFVYENEKLVQTIDLEESDHHFTLPLNGFYAVEIASNGYHSKKINVNTYTTSQSVAKVEAFDVELISKRKHKQPLADVAAALIRYDSKSGKMISDDTYRYYVEQNHPILAGL